MVNNLKKKVIFFMIGTLLGALFVSAGGLVAYKAYKEFKKPVRYGEKKTLFRLPQFKFKKAAPKEFFLSFENRDDIEFFQADETTTIEASKQNATHGNHSLKVMISAGSEFPGILWEVYGNKTLDWKRAKDFHFDAYNSGTDDVRLEVKFKSGKDYPKKSFSYPVSLAPQTLNHVRIPIETISQACDVDKMSYIKIFAKSPGNEITLYIDNLGIRDPDAKDAVSSAAYELGNETVSAAIKNLEEGFEVLIASSLDRIFRDGKTLQRPSFQESADIAIAKNEYESFQVVVRNGRDLLKGVSLEMSDLVNDSNAAMIDKANISWRVVGYVQTIKPYYPVKYVGLWPDPLVPGSPTDIQPGNTQPFWVTIHIPHEASAGTYHGQILLSGEGIPKRAIPLKVVVYDFSIPKENHLKTAFDFYGHITHLRFPQGEKENNEAYQARLVDINEKFIIEMIKYRMNPILNIDPASQQDLARVDRYRFFGMNNFAIGRKGGTFQNNWPTDDDGLEKMFDLYRTYGEILKLNKMLQYTYIYTWDEGEIGNPMVAKICSMVHRAYPGLKNMVCYHGFWEPEKDPLWGKDIDIWCFQIDNFVERKMRKLQELGKEIWMYISGPSGYSTPNLAIDFDSIDYRISPWLCWKYDIKGLLYWCVNWWMKVDPYKSAANSEWEQNGNGLLFYPGKDGPVASLRAEILRDGMEDYEYFWVLIDKIKELKRRGMDKQYQDVIDEGITLLTMDNTIAESMFSFTKETSVLLDRRNKIAGMIERIGELLKENPKS